MSYHPERKTLTRLLESGARVSWRHHARDRAKARDVQTFIAERIVRTGAVTRVSIEPSGAERFHVSGRDADGRPVDVVIEMAEAAVAIVTVIRTDE